MKNSYYSDQISLGKLRISPLMMGFIFVQITRKQIFLFTGLVLAFLLNLSLLTKGHDWGGDFSSYVVQARSICHGTIAEFVSINTFIINDSSAPVGPITYPWGAPLLLSTLYAAFGMNIWALKFLNLFCYQGALIAIFLFFRGRFSKIPTIIATAIFALHPYILVSSNHVGSDIPFLFFVLLSLYFMDRIVVRNKLLRKFLDKLFNDRCSNWDNINCTISRAVFDSDLIHIPRNSIFFR